MRRITSVAEIFDALADEPWIVEGAAVRVALIAFAAKGASAAKKNLNGERVDHINANLTAGLDTSSVIELSSNKNVSFVGIQKSGPFDVPGDLARGWLVAPMNPNRRPNADVLRPTSNGIDITSGRRDVWLIDYPRGLSEADAALWELPFRHLETAPYDPEDPETGTLRGVRAGARDFHPRHEWWTTYWPRPDVRALLNNLSRFIVTPMTAEHRIFVWVALPKIPDNNTIIIARDDDACFGMLQSRIHESWTTLIGNRMGVGNQRRYNPASVFATFAFPEGLTPDIPAENYADDPRAQKIAAAAARLNELRENWLNPPDLVTRVPEVVEGYPDRIMPVDEEAEKIIKKRTLTSLYNERPAWLDHAHAALDEAAAEAYGWGDDWRAGNLNEDEILSRLFRLNQERAAEHGLGVAL